MSKVSRRNFIQLTGVTALGAVVPISLYLDTGELGFPDLPKVSYNEFFQTIDLTEGVKHFLSSKLKKVVDHKTHQLVYEFNKPIPGKKGEYVRDYRIVNYYGVRTRNLKKACKELAKIITEAHETSKIMATLNVGSAVAIADNSYVCITYFATDKPFESKWKFPEQNDTVKNLPGEKLEDLSHLEVKQSKELDDILKGKSSNKLVVRNPKENNKLY